MEKKRYGEGNVGAVIVTFGGLSLVCAVLCLILALVVKGSVSQDSFSSNAERLKAANAAAFEAMGTGFYYLEWAIVIFVVAHLVQQYMWVCKNCGACVRRFGK